MTVPKEDEYICVVGISNTIKVKGDTMLVSTARTTGSYLEVIEIRGIGAYVAFREIRFPLSPFFAVEDQYCSKSKLSFFPGDLHPIVINDEETKEKMYETVEKLKKLHNMHRERLTHVIEQDIKSIEK